MCTMRVGPGATAGFWALVKNQSRASWGCHWQTASWVQTCPGECQGWKKWANFMSHQGLTGCEPTLTRFTFSSITCVAASSSARKKINYLCIWEGTTANSHHPLQQLQLGSRMAGANVPEACHWHWRQKWQVWQCCGCEVQLQTHRDYDKSSALTGTGWAAAGGATAAWEFWTRLWFSFLFWNFPPAVVIRLQGPCLCSLISSWRWQELQWQWVGRGNWEKSEVLLLQPLLMVNLLSWGKVFFLATRFTG